MAEYIEREKTIRDLEKLCADGKMIGNDNSTYIDFADAIEVVAEQPTADVQEIVRCKDCIFGKYDDDLNMILCKRIYNLSDGECVYNDLNDFCSFGAKWIRSDEKSNA